MFILTLTFVCLFSSFLPSFSYSSSVNHNFLDVCSSYLPCLPYDFFVSVFLLLSVHQLQKILLYFSLGVSKKCFVFGMDSAWLKWNIIFKESSPGFTQMSRRPPSTVKEDISLFLFYVSEAKFMPTARPLNVCFLLFMQTSGFHKTICYYRKRYTYASRDEIHVVFVSMWLPATLPFSSPFLTIITLIIEDLWQRACVLDSLTIFDRKKFQTKVN